MQRKRITVLGFFVIVAFLALCFTVITFMPQYSLDYSKTYVIYFEGQLTGLQEGSAVTLRGIKVGQVTKLNLEFDKKLNQFNVPVQINFFKKKSGKLADHRFIKRLIKQGLRAELHVQNFITGNAAIEMEFRPGSTGYTVKQENSKLTEIPSVPDDEQAANLGSAISAAKDMFNSVEKLAKSPKIDGTLTAVTNAADKVTTLSSNVNDQIPSISDNISESSHAIKTTAYSIRTFSDYLSRHPEALIKGKRASN